MPCRKLVLTFALACGLGAQARELQIEPNGPSVAETPQEELLAQQRRREVLRQATRAQRDDTPIPTRQLTTRERVELRQQLQQQRRELLKP